MYSKRRLPWGLILASLLFVSGIVLADDPIPLPLPGGDVVLHGNRASGDISNVVMLDKGAGTYMVQADVNVDAAAEDKKTLKITVPGTDTVKWVTLGVGYNRVQFDGIPRTATQMKLSIQVNGSSVSSTTTDVNPLSVEECFQTSVGSNAAPKHAEDDPDRLNSLVVVVPCMDLPVQLIDGSSYYPLTPFLDMSTGMPLALTLHSRDKVGIRFTAVFKQRGIRWMVPYNTVNHIDNACEAGHIFQQNSGDTVLDVLVNYPSVVTVYDATDTSIRSAVEEQPGWVHYVIPDLDFVQITCERTDGGDMTPIYPPVFARRLNKEAAQ